MSSRTESIDLNGHAALPSTMQRRYENARAFYNNYNPAIFGSLEQIDDYYTYALEDQIATHVSGLPTSDIIMIKGESSEWSKQISLDNPEISALHKAAFQKRSRDIDSRLSGALHHSDMGLIDAHWTQSVEKNYLGSLLGGIQLKLLRGCLDYRKPDPTITPLLQRLPIDDTEAEMVCDQWLNESLRTIASPDKRIQRDVGEISKQLGLFYANLCKYRADGTERKATDGIDKRLVDSKSAILRVRQERAEQSSNHNEADALELLAHGFYRPRRVPQQITNEPVITQQSLRTLREQRRVDVTDTEVMRAVISENVLHNTLQKEASRHRVLKAASVTTAALAVATLGMQSAAAATRAELPTNIPTLAVATQKIVKLPIGIFESATSTQIQNNTPPATPNISTAVQDFQTEAVVSPAVLNTGDSGQADAIQAAYANVNAIVPDMSIVQITSAPPAPKPNASPNSSNSNGGASPEQPGAAVPPPSRLDIARKIVSIAGLPAATADILSNTTNINASLEQSNPLLNDQLQKRIDNYSAQLDTLPLTTDESNQLGLTIAQIQAGLKNPASLTNISPDDKKEILSAEDSGYGTIIEAQKTEVAGEFSSSAYKNWNGLTADQKNILVSLVATADLNVMDQAQVLSLLDAAQQALTPPQVAPQPSQPNAPTSPEASTPTAPRWDAAIAKAAQDNGWSSNKTIFMTEFSRYALSQGGNIATVAGVAGNVMVESAGYDMNQVEFGTGIGFGYVQYSFGRRTQFEAAVRRAGLNPYKESTALARFSVKYIINDSQSRVMRNGSGNEWKGLAAITDPVAAASGWQWNFERPASRSIQSQRTKEASRVYDQINAADVAVRAAASKSAATNAAQAAAAAAAKAAAAAQAQANNNGSNSETVAWNQVGELGTNTAITLSSPTGVDLKTAMKIANNLVAGGSAYGLVCTNNGNCYEQCDHVATAVWGYKNSGYNSAKIHRQAMDNNNQLHVDREPPVGAILYYDYSGGPYGHAAVYMGNGKVLSTDIGGNGSVSIVDSSQIETGKWHLKYRGWSAPIATGSSYSQSQINMLSS